MKRNFKRFFSLIVLIAIIINLTGYTNIFANTSTESNNTNTSTTDNSNTSTSSNFTIDNSDYENSYKLYKIENGELIEASKDTLKTGDRVYSHGREGYYMDTDTTTPLVFTHEELEATDIIYVFTYLPEELLN